MQLMISGKGHKMSHLVIPSYFGTFMFQLSCAIGIKRGKFIVTYRNNHFQGVSLTHLLFVISNGKPDITFPAKNIPIENTLVHPELGCPLPSQILVKVQLVM